MQPTKKYSGYKWYMYTYIRLGEVLCEMNLFWKCLYSFSSKHVIVHYVHIKYPAMTYFDVLLYFNVANTNISRHEDYDHIPEISSANEIILRNSHSQRVLDLKSKLLILA